ncbi:hypothetical protein FPV67DRAFT_1675187 [Lyophyllum atratum]|nr:hypothetical protein FPV67DRAFT_1675187 [Lyophyllum atratum]
MPGTRSKYPYGSPALEQGDSVDELDLNGAEQKLPIVYGRLEVDLGNVDPKIRPLAERLQALFRNKEESKQLLACRNSSAQRLLDIFQRLLDNLDAPPTSFHRHLIKNAQRLSFKSGLYPTCYELKDIPVPVYASQTPLTGCPNTTDMPSRHI